MYFCFSALRESLLNDKSYFATFAHHKRKKEIQNIFFLLKCNFIYQEEKKQLQRKEP